MKLTNNSKSRVNHSLKRVFDLILIVLSMPLILLVICIISILIKLDSEGPVFFIQERLGKDGKIFKCLKFRTMYVNADEILETYLQGNSKAQEEWRKYKKLKNHDPRVTKIGKFLRKSSLDELPQIFNVLKGDMSLVGPRPYLPRELPEMGKFKEIIFMTRPGITGLWQVSGRNKLTFEQRLKLDAWYVLNWSLWLDVVILLKTIKVVLKREGAY
jgi:undecaprenyl-phosphate galactose phosphotransferase